MIVKHWRQNWLYENTNLYSYNADNVWTYESKSADEVAGQWTQKVYQVDDSPRYSGSATWFHADGKTFWENSSDSPLPRREYSKRSDYNVLHRGNRQEITETGWLHEQDNDKVIRAEGKKDVLLAQEKGYNIYYKIDDKECAPAANWWNDHKDFWAKARNAWDEVYKREGDLTLKQKVDGQPMFMKFYELEEKDAGKRKIMKMINEYINEKNSGNAESK